MHDRDYYRAMSDEQLLDTARRDGIHAEMAVAIAEALAERTGYGSRGNFEFNHRSDT